MKILQCSEIPVITVTKNESENGFWTVSWKVESLNGENLKKLKIVLVEVSPTKMLK